MICRKCGTEIADKALICYRCGTSTLEPATSVTPRRPAPPLWTSVVALVILVIAALFMATAATGETPRLLGWALVVLAGVLLAWRFLRRRSSR